MYFIIDSCQAKKENDGKGKWGKSIHLLSDQESGDVVRCPKLVSTENDF